MNRVDAQRSKSAAGQRGLCIGVALTARPLWIDGLGGQGFTEERCLARPNR
jgi:hypothetical protein